MPANPALRRRGRNSLDSRLIWLPSERLVLKKEGREEREKRGNGVGTRSQRGKGGWGRVLA